MHVGRHPVPLCVAVFVLGGRFAVSEHARTYGSSWSLGYCRRWRVVNDKCSSRVIHLALKFRMTFDAKNGIICRATPDGDQPLFAHVTAHRVTKVALELQWVTLAFRHIPAGYGLSGGEENVRRPQMARSTWQNF